MKERNLKERNFIDLPFSLRFSLRVNYIYLRWTEVWNRAIYINKGYKQACKCILHMESAYTDRGIVFFVQIASSICIFRIQYHINVYVEH